MEVEATMRTLLLPAIPLLLAALAGCVGTEEPPAEAPGGEVAREAEDGPMAPSPASLPKDDDASANATRLRALPLAFDGNVGAGAFACLSTIQNCQAVTLAPRESSLVVEGERGRISGGELTLSWTPASPATEELSFGLMLMGSEDEACPSTDLGTVQGVSPLVIQPTDPGRGLCPDEVIHAWVAGTLWGGQDPVYYQADLDQDFHLEGTLLLAGG